MSRRKRAAGLVLAVIAVFFCSGVQPAAAAPELRLSPASGPPGSTFLVTGTGFAPAEVLIRWGDEAGPELGRAVGPEFTVEVTVPPDAPSNSHPVMAVVTDGGSVSTSSAPFQVTRSEPEPPPTTSTTVDEAPVDTTPATTPTTAPASSPPSAAGGGLSRTDSVGGGVDGGAMADTTNGGGEAGADTTGGRTGGAGSTTGGAAAGAAGATTTTNVPGADAAGPAGAATPPPGAAGAGAPLSGDDRAGAPRQGAGEASGSALAPRPTSQSAGAVRNPLLLFVGLGLVFAAGVVLAVRNHQRTARPPEPPGQ